MPFLSFPTEDKRGTVGPQSADVSQISITAQNKSHISAPVILNSAVTGNINIANNYFTGVCKPSLLVEVAQQNITVIQLIYCYTYCNILF